MPSDFEAVRLGTQMIGVVNHPRREPQHLALEGLKRLETSVGQVQRGDRGFFSHDGIRVLGPEMLAKVAPSNTCDWHWRIRRKRNAVAYVQGGVDLSAADVLERRDGAACAR